MTTTVSKILASSLVDKERNLLLLWCDEAAKNGGSFSIASEYSGHWYTVYTINWPTHMTAKELK